MKPVRIQSGMTLVELLVATAISLLVAIAAGYALLSGRQGFATVDATSQVRDNARFAAEMINRLVLQAGFRDVVYAATPRETSAGSASNPAPGVYGANDARPDSADPSRVFLSGGVNGSDVLVLRYQAVETYPGSGMADPSVIDCTGRSVPIAALPKSRDDMLASVLYVESYRGEPTLFCVTVDAAGNPGVQQPLVSGVETLQVLYGTDGVTPGAAPSTPADSVVDRFVSARDLEVSGDDEATYMNWRRVRSIRVGMVLRGPVVPVEELSAEEMYPLGAFMRSAADAGSAFTPDDGRRLRQTLTFTVHLRNDQGL